ncbi:peptidoglycan-binding protein [Nocardiopsis akebiae]|uniref:Peptidoglycan-binding protein n=1 Tax=Nocardiopsis akebiae TaxID=2831968 RepID=A0ABX8C6W8_9ACTN|nr:peptidoglycan-binding protein [Nocardiopsis akebiae]QUX29249.1 peptidoglycan-binding protein [Nocardiopsis akebiae]
MSADTALLPEEEREEERPRRRRPGPLWLGAALLTLVVLCGVAWATVRGLPGDSPGGEAPDPGPTARVERTTMLREETFDGALGYAGGGTFFARSDGVVTRLPGVGSELTAGDLAWEVDGRPTVLLHGDRPAYRPLAPGSSGEDVRQFEQALAGLGYSGFTVDDEYTWLTAEAVRRWQDDTEGMEVTGEVRPSQIWYTSGAVRVTGHEVDVSAGVAPGTPLLTTSSTRQVVRVDLPVGDRDLLTDDAGVTVRLPGGENVAGVVESVGTVATVEEGEEGGGGGDPTVEVVIDLEEDAADFLDQAPVTVVARGESREDVLAAPVGALIALPGDRYGLSVVDGDGTVHDVPVETGWFSDGRVEVSGEGIGEGTEVVVPE